MKKAAVKHLAVPYTEGAYYLIKTLEEKMMESSLYRGRDLIENDLPLHNNNYGGENL
ncbi:MAG: hypothetical protein ACOYBD_11330 [Bilifractor sp.]|jgi:hypothetical protein